MSKAKYIMPTARLASATSLMVTGGIRQASPEGSALTVAIFGAGAVNFIQAILDFRNAYNKIEQPTAPLQEIVTEKTDFRTAIFLERAAAVASSEVEKSLSK